MRARAAAAGLTVVVAAMLAGLLAPAAAVAARLVGGRAESAIERVFSASHRGALIVSVRRSTVAPAWSAVRWAAPEANAARPAPLLSSYYRSAGGRQWPGRPPAAVARDLSRDLRVAVVYTGSGSETIAYDQMYPSNCAGVGEFTDAESIVVAPMSWTVRYTVDLDHPVAIAGGPAGAVAAPLVAFDAAGSRVEAVETRTRTLQETGCTGAPTTVTCRTGFGLGGADPGGQLTLAPGTSLEVGLPLTGRSSGTCDPTGYVLGPSLWAAGGAGAVADGLRLAGGLLPTNPYAPIRVSWPSASPGTAAGLLASPCSGDIAACSDAFSWTGTVRLVALG